MTQNISKALVFGSSDGEFKKIFEKTYNLNKKHNFDFLLCIGDFLPEFNTNDSEIIDLIEGKIHSNHFILSSRKSETITTSKGIKISYLGGMYKEDIFSYEMSQQNAKTEQYIYKSEIDYIMKKGKDTDILVTYEWPKDIYKFSSKKSSKFISGIELIAKITSYIQPKYHFSSKGSIFYEREPYKNTFNKNKQKTNITRFISLASLSNPNKEKSSYAFNITTSNSYDILNTSNISNATENPFIQEINTNFKEINHNSEKSEYSFFCNKKIFSNNQRQEHDSKSHVESYEYINEGKNKETNTRISKTYVCHICNKTNHLIYNCPELKTKKSNKNNIPSNYTCKICSQKGHWIQNCPQKKNYNFQKTINNYPDLKFCFFCLSNPKIARHLIISIGLEVYLALPKGPLTTSSTNPSTLQFPGHILIIPIAHVPTINAVEKINRDETKKEMERQAIKFFISLLMIEDIEYLLAKSTGIHLHWQIIPVKKDFTDKLENAFISYGNEKHYSFEKRDIEKEEENYLRVWLPNESILVHKINPQKCFDSQFPRYVISQVLGIEERKDWKNCVQTNEEECQDAAQFKKHFKNFDFTI
ncbi:hypothetical protein PMAC_001700 [Pneumocystis sp. 'macacae']|nr:hypothetical protein PMAC_001700 [Pneumocystis sp. 'macacae']